MRKGRKKMFRDTMFNYFRISCLDEGLFWWWFEDMRGYLYWDEVMNDS